MGTYYLQEKSLDWSIKHLCRFYDSDFFPRCFEFEAIRLRWSDIKKDLLSKNLCEYYPQQPLSLLAIKPDYSHRVVHQLDPLDSVLYTALVFELSAD